MRVFAVISGVHDPAGVHSSTCTFDGDGSSTYYIAVQGVGDSTPINGNPSFEVFTDYGSLGEYAVRIDFTIEDECTADASCDDGLFCNGAETCDTSGGSPGVCVPGTAPSCSPGSTQACAASVCSESTDACVDDTSKCCSTDAGCDNGLFCDGSETCNPTTGFCDAGVSLFL